MGRGEPDPGGRDQARRQLRRRLPAANAKAVFAEGITSASYVLAGIFRSSETMGQIFMSAPSATGARDFTFSSVRTPGKRAWMDPFEPGRYYRSVIGNLSLSAAKVRGS